MKRLTWIGCGLVAVLGVWALTWNSASRTQPSRPEVEPAVAAVRGNKILTVQAPAPAHATEPAAHPVAAAQERRERPVLDLSRFKDTRRPIAERLEEIAQLARSEEASSIGVLMALGDEQTYLRWAAVEALGKVRKPEVEVYLRNKLSDPDPGVLSYALRGYAEQKGADAVPSLLEVLQRNRRRNDGMEEGVLTETVKMLGRIGSSAALPALVQELERVTSEKGVSLEYGSAVLTALLQIRDPQARGAVEHYSAKLAELVPADPKFKKYWEDKVAEARKASASL